MGHSNPEVVFGDRHDVDLTPGGVFQSLYGCEQIRVNSLHGQAILDCGDRVVVEGVAEDGTIEAIQIADAPGFALGVQWHAEYRSDEKPANKVVIEPITKLVMLAGGIFLIRPFFISSALTESMC